MKTPSETVEILWQFVRGDTPPQVFEQWLYSAPQLEVVFGERLYMKSIETNFADRNAVGLLKKDLGVFAAKRDQGLCHCVRHPNLAVVDMGNHDDLFSTLERTCERGDPFWWLYVSGCTVCAQKWLVAQEERHNDVFIMKRIGSVEVKSIEENNLWPADFDRYEALLEIGNAAGCAVTYADPLDSSLVWTVGDLAKARPGIRVSELASLLGVSIELAEALAQKASKTEPFDIAFDTKPSLGRKPWWRLW
jgi:hypothetical protein